MTNKIILGAMAMDLKRIALSLNRGSYKTAERFEKELMEQKNILKKEEMSSYLIKILDKLEKSLKNSNLAQKAEDSIMYSTLLQNYFVHKLS